jgi:hypothetical protein
LVNSALLGCSFVLKYLPTKNPTGLINSWAAKQLLTVVAGLSKYSGTLLGTAYSIILAGLREPLIKRLETAFLLLEKHFKIIKK